MKNVKSEDKRSTLKNSLDILNRRNDEISELVDLSNILLGKFINPRNEPMNLEEKLPKKEREAETLVELFDFNSDKIKKNIDILGNNLQKILNMID